MNANANETCQQLFGRQHAALLHDFPACMGEFERRTGGKLGSPRNLVLRHTLLGYFLPFVERVAAEHLLEGVVTGSVPDLRMRLGIPASRVGGYHPLRCCKDCIDEDLRDVGWPVWRVVHQAPSVLVCIRHMRPLVQSWHPTSPVHRREWLQPSAKPSSERQEIRIVNDKALAMQARLSAISERVLSAEPGSWGLERINRIYRRWAATQGAMTGGGSIRHGAARAALAGDFEILRGPFLALGPVACDLRLESIVDAVTRRAWKPQHPLKLLALLTVMFDSADDDEVAMAGSATSDDAAVSSVLEGPPLTAVVSSKADLAAGDPRHAIFVHSIAEGHSVRSASKVAEVSGNTGVRWARQLGVTFTPRPKKVQASARELMRSALRLGQERADVATAHGVAVGFVHRLLSTEHEVLALWRAARDDRTRHAHRATMIAVLAKLPQATSTQLRKVAPREWTWLYRNDADWLSALMPVSAQWSARARPDCASE